MLGISFMFKEVLKVHPTKYLQLTKPKFKIYM